MTTNFGSDLADLYDVDETRVVTGVALVAQDVYWRLKTPRGEGILEGDAPNYGIDLLAMLGTAENESEAAALPGRIQTALSDDPRIATTTVRITRVVEGPAAQWDVFIRCETAEGPFELVGLAGSDGFDLAVKILPAGEI